MTYLEIVNKVLTRLREDTVTSYNETAYSTLISDFVNQAKQEVEDAWDWTSLRSSITITTAASTYTYTATGLNNRSRIKHIINDTEDTIMKIVPHTYMHNMHTLGITQEAAPIYLMFEGETTNVPDIQIWPIPDAIYSLILFGHIPQDDLTDDSTELTVPDLPVILGAYAYALEERGEDGGNSFNTALNKYDSTLGEYIAIDSARVPQEGTWMVE